MVQLSQSGRVCTLVAISQGNVYTANPGDTEWTTPTNSTGETPPLNFTGVMQSTQCNQKLWFADGTNWVYFDPALNVIDNWVATAGTLPEDEEGNYPRLICTWRGRVVLSGLLLDAQNWFMAAVSDPTDFDYSPTSQTPTQAIAGNNAPQGLIGDVITALIPYSDDRLIMGGDSSIYMFSGDPMAGGQIDRVSDAIGIAWGAAWCKDPYGNIYFVSNRTGIYTLTPGQQPQRISQQIEQLLQQIDTGASTINLIWDDRFQGLHVFVTPTDEPGEPGDTTHFFHEQRSGAWWTQKFANPNHDPLCCCVFDGNLPTDRVALLGGWDGYVRFLDPEAEDDDGWEIASEVWIGPLVSKNLDTLLLKEIQAVLGETSGQVDFAVHVGTTAEQALSSEPAVSGTWGAGRNLSNLIRRSGHAVFVKLTATTPWALEVIRVRLAPLGKVQMRGA